ncbi:MAG: hypothetical protein ACP5UM_00470 [Anaerolineae bacterium]
MRVGLHLLALVLAAGLLAACAPPPRALPTASPVPTPTPPEGTAEGEMPTPLAPSGLTARERAAADLCAATLAGQLAIPVETIQVLEVEAVEWPDTSLGCPEPGMMYAQVITPGYRVRLRAGEATYTLHTDGKRAVSCTAPTP